MTSEYLNNDDPEEWIKDRKSTQFQEFQNHQVVGQHCERCQYDPDPVIRRGSLEADLMVVGNQVSSRNQNHGKPFSGDAGSLLRDMLEAIDLNWEEDTYITNALLCRTSKEDPRPSSLKACYENLSRQIEIVSPDVILTLGKLAYQSLYLETSDGTLKNNLGTQKEIPKFPWVTGVVTFHPKSILQNKDQPKKTKKLKKVVWDHLQRVKGELTDEDDTNSEAD